MSIRLFRWFGLLALLCSGLALAGPPDASEMATIRQRLAAAGLARADIVQGGDGRITLVGSYRDRAEVLTAFSIAQQEVGVKWVAPTTPENIKYVFDNALNKFCAALGTCPKPGAPAGGGSPSAPGGGGTAPPAPRPGMAGAAPKKYAVVVGVGDFASPQVPALQYTTRDAQLVYDYLVDPRGGAFPRDNVVLLKNQQATRAGIEEAMERVVQLAAPNDLVLLYISSHGTPPNDRGTMQIITYDTQVKPRERVFLTSLSDDKVASFAERLGPARLVVVLDTCYSGAAFEKVPGFLATGAKDLRLDEERDTVVGMSGKSLHTMATGAKDLHFEDEKSPLPPPANQGPRVLMSASDAGQKSWESDRLQQSFFTHHLVNELRRTPDLERAYLAAKPKVATQVRQEKRADQTPQGVFMPRGTSFSLR